MTAELADDFADASRACDEDAADHVREATRRALAAVGVEAVPRDEYERIARSVFEADVRRADPERRRRLDERLAEYTRR
ncbi:hypothetical protein [Catellatospora chokoriensis]|uniref:Uncharacterized protein n=1 Tax=Catellatospora chokoriensis TaxID=310353 RepID=A0A8J3NQC0_9ACTN|nr:hypothetical protein [Catellatospora chokoriensis]GIF88123.1 hypothetical protein Cch02nite_15670 [Catellatospora chokoriensis]